MTNQKNIPTNTNPTSLPDNISEETGYIDSRIDKTKADIINIINQLGNTTTSILDNLEMSEQDKTPQETDSSVTQQKNELSNSQASNMIDKLYHNAQTGTEKEKAKANEVLNKLQSFDRKSINIEQSNKITQNEQPLQEAENNLKSALHKTEIIFPKQLKKPKFQDIPEETIQEELSSANQKAYKSLYSEIVNNLKKAYDSIELFLKTKSSSISQQTRNRLKKISNDIVKIKQFFTISAVKKGQDAAAEIHKITEKPQVSNNEDLEETPEITFNEITDAIKERINKGIPYDNLLDQYAKRTHANGLTENYSATLTDVHRADIYVNGNKIDNKLIIDKKEELKKQYQNDQELVQALLSQVILENTKIPLNEVAINELAMHCNQINYDGLGYTILMLDDKGEATALFQLLFQNNISPNIDQKSIHFNFEKGDYLQAKVDNSWQLLQVHTEKVFFPTIKSSIKFDINASSGKAKYENIVISYKIPKNPILIDHSIDKSELDERKFEYEEYNMPIRHNKLSIDQPLDNQDEKKPVDTEQGNNELSSNESTDLNNNDSTQTPSEHKKLTQHEEISAINTIEKNIEHTITEIDDTINIIDNLNAPDQTNINTVQNTNSNIKEEQLNDIKEPEHIKLFREIDKKTAQGRQFINSRPDQKFSTDSLENINDKQQITSFSEDMSEEKVDLRIRELTKDIEDMYNKLEAQESKDLEKQHKKPLQKIKRLLNRALHKIKKIIPEKYEIHENPIYTQQAQDDKIYSDELKAQKFQPSLKTIPEETEEELLLEAQDGYNPPVYSRIINDSIKINRNIDEYQKTKNISILEKIKNRLSVIFNSIINIKQIFTKLSTKKGQSTAAEENKIIEEIQSLNENPVNLEQNIQNIPEHTDHPKDIRLNPVEQLLHTFPQEIKNEFINPVKYPFSTTDTNENESNKNSRLLFSNLDNILTIKGESRDKNVHIKKLLLLNTSLLKLTDYISNFIEYDQKKSSFKPRMPNFSSEEISIILKGLEVIQDNSKIQLEAEDLAKMQETISQCKKLAPYMEQTLNKYQNTSLLYESSLFSQLSQKAQSLIFKDNIWPDKTKSQDVRVKALYQTLTDKINRTNDSKLYKFVEYTQKLAQFSQDEQEYKHLGTGAPSKPPRLPYFTLQDLSEISKSLNNIENTNDGAIKELAQYMKNILNVLEEKARNNINQPSSTLTAQIKVENKENLRSVSKEC